jgi:hypothetical protein
VVELQDRIKQHGVAWHAGLRQRWTEGAEDNVLRLIPGDDETAD